MTLDRYKTEYHLTPRGWISGEAQHFGADVGEERPPPNDRVETWEHYVKHVKQQAGYAREQHTWRRTWKDPDADVEGLRERWGVPCHDHPPISQEAWARAIREGS